MLVAYAAGTMVIAHDCGLVGNPSHTGVDDMDREYTPEQHARMIVYHYGSHADGAAITARGYRVAQRDERIDLHAPAAEVVLAQTAKNS